MGVQLPHIRSRHPLTVKIADEECTLREGLRDDIESAVLLDGVSSIYDRAFKNCSRMRSIQIQRQSLPSETRHSPTARIWNQSQSQTPLRQSASACFPWAIFPCSKSPSRSSPSVEARSSTANTWSDWSLREHALHFCRGSSDGEAGDPAHWRLPL